MKLLVAPDKFRDALAAGEAAEAIAAGLRDALAQADIAQCPLADGGEGSGRILAAALGAAQRRADVLDPRGRLRAASWWHEQSGATAIVELAEASGLGLLAADERHADLATTYGTGQLLRAAVLAGCERILLCVGGSATVDGGAGCLQAVGYRFFDASGRELTEPLCGGRLQAVSRLEPPAAPFPAEVVVLCDVDNPLLGPSGAAPVFAPQKGANQQQVRALDDALAHWAGILERCTACDVRDVARGGAAGGIAAGLHAALGARLVNGFETVAREVGLAERIRPAEAVVTGEGRLDAQTTGGKVVAGVARLAREVGRPVFALVGALEVQGAAERRRLAETLGLEEIRLITPPDMKLDEALRTAGENLRRAAAELAQERWCC